MKKGISVNAAPVRKSKRRPSRLDDDERNALVEANILWAYRWAAKYHAGLPEEAHRAYTLEDA